MNSNIKMAFSNWLQSLGYKPKKYPLSIQFFKHKHKMLELDYTGRMNKAMDKAWNLFLQKWLENGKEFLEMV